MTVLASRASFIESWIYQLDMRRCGGDSDRWRVDSGDRITSGKEEVMEVSVMYIAREVGQVSISNLS